MKSLFPILTIALLLATLILVYRFSELSNQVEKLENPKGQVIEETNEMGELAVYMSRMQLYTAKLYFAGEAGNEELTKFYLHELEEIMEDLEKSKETEHGVVIGEAIKAYGTGSIAYFEQMIEQEGMPGFSKAYDNLVSSCNGCHASTGHGFIRIIRPEYKPFGNQDYASQK